MRHGRWQLGMLVVVFMAECVVASAMVTAGSYRWRVKTCGDGFRPGAARASTVSDLVDAAPPSGACGASAERTECERVAYVVRGTITVIRREADGDVHLGLTDGRRTMVVEVPLPRFCPAWLRDSVGQARVVARQLKVGDRVRVVGVRFYDKVHGAVGGATNGVELHPVLELGKVVGR